MSFPEPLNSETDAHRRALAQWLATARAPQDFVCDERGNRIYNKERLNHLIVPLLRSMGLSTWGYTFWRISAFTQVDAIPPAQLWVIPVHVVSGEPVIVQRGRRDMIVPGWYSVAIGSFALTPQFDCLFMGGIPRSMGGVAYGGR